MRWVAKHCSWLLFLLALAGAAEARMYQWVSASSGTVQMSGAPPSWYRSGQAGPRVLVFQDGRLVDDTGIPVAEERRQALRGEALQEVAQRRELEALKHLEKTALREAARRQAAGQEAEPAAPGGGRELEPQDLDQAAVAQLKALISEWDSRNAEPAGIQGSGLTPERLRAIVSEWDQRNPQQ